MVWSGPSVVYVLTEGQDGLLERVQCGKEEFLGELSNVSDVSVTSKHPLETTTKTLLLRAGAAPLLRDDAPRAPNSTCVRAARLFWNVPVRQRSVRAAAEWEAVRVTVLEAALACPSVAFQLRDLDSGRSLLALPPRLFVDRLLEVTSGGSVVVVSSSSSSAAPVQATLYAVRGGAAAGTRLQCVQVNGAPAAVEWLTASVARDLSWAPAGPMKMGSPRAASQFVLQLSCAPDWVQLSAAGGTVWFGAVFGDEAAVKRAVREAVAQVAAVPRGVPSLRQSSPFVASPKPATGAAASPVPQRSPVCSPSMRKTAGASPSPSPQTAEQVLAGWSNPCLKFNSQLLLPLPPPPAGASQEVRLHKRDLHSVRVLGQVERKLIVAVVGHRLVVAFDQHAVHERVLLEALQADPALTESPPMRETAQCVRHLGDAALRHRLALLPWFRIDEQRQMLTGCAVWDEEHALTAQDLEEHLGDLCAGAQGLPRCVQRLLAYRACRSANKFGDAVSPERAAALLAQLAQCDFPFVCAHGRQSVALLAQL